ncbi:MAG: hypothetical protein IPO43_17070 [Rhodoferax sp.]|nr:hypothetical protein [Rhodoferax sp.]
MGEYTFEEAFKRTKRIINITVSPVAKHQHARLLNYLTTATPAGVGAVLASCSVPGLFPPVKLMTKGTGWGTSGPTWPRSAGSMARCKSDLPAKRLGELYNVNHHIVSQTNPHVLPFMTDQSRKEGWTRFLTDLVKSEMQYRSKQMLLLASYGIETGIVKGLLEGGGAGGPAVLRRCDDPSTHGGNGLSACVGQPVARRITAVVLAGERATGPRSP